MQEKTKETALKWNAFDAFFLSFSFLSLGYKRSLRLDSDHRKSDANDKLRKLRKMKMSMELNFFIFCGGFACSPGLVSSLGK